MGASDDVVGSLLQDRGHITAGWRRTDPMVRTTANSAVGSHANMLPTDGAVLLTRRTHRSS